jgi:DoxX-like family
MFTAYVVVTLMAVAASTFVAVANFMRLEFVLTTAAKVSVPESWITVLGTLNAAAALGLLLGLAGVPLVGTAAAIGLVLYFVGAIVTHLRVRDYSIGPAATFLLLAVAALVLELVS